MNDMTEEDLVTYSIILAAEFVTIVFLCCVHRSRYLNEITMERIEKELERQDRKHDQKAIQLGIKDPLADALEEREHKAKMDALRERGEELQRENARLLPIGLVDHRDLFNRRMRQTAAAGFGRKRESLVDSQLLAQGVAGSNARNSYRSAM